MKWYNNIKISHKIILGFIIIAIFSGIISTFAIGSIRTIINLDKKLYEENTVPLNYLYKIQNEFSSIRINVSNIGIDKDKDKKTYEDSINNSLKELSNNIVLYSKYIKLEKEKADFYSLTDSIAKYTDDEQTLVNLFDSNQNAEALILMNGEVNNIGKKVESDISALFNNNLQTGKKLSGDNTSTGNNVILIMLVIAILALVFAIIIGIVIARVITKNIGKLVDSANKISNGDLDFNIEIRSKDEFGILGNAFIKIINSLKNLIKDTDMLTKAAVVGKLNIRADGKKHNGDYRKIVDGINKTLDTLIGHIDLLPSPLLIMDKDFNIQYINKTGSELIGQTQSAIIGTKCYDNFKTSHCSTKNCACNLAMQNSTFITRETDAHPNGKSMDIKYTGIPVKDENEEVIGVMELIIDQTEIKEAMRKSIEQSKQLEATSNITAKQVEFQKNKVELLLVNLEKLSKGDLDIELNAVDRDGVLIDKDIIDEDTNQIAENFKNINNNLDKSVQAIKLMTRDAGMLTKAAATGDLSYRADESKHEGEYLNIIQGVNKTLDAITEPVQETSAVLRAMASGNLKLRVQGNYMGEHADIKNAMNNTLDLISLYINEISEVLNGMANSNLNLELSNDYKGDFREIKKSLNYIITSFNSIFSDINNSSDQVATGSKQVSYGSQALSQGATEQASSIEELNASINEVALQTKENALNADKANELALSAKDNAESGNSQMKEMLRSMQDINEASTRISKIIKVIDDIAFQTNILALNAAVEAARAGQQGKGFAVVAQEVRNLAARSANAAKETAELIEESIKKTKYGTKIASGAAKSLDGIVVEVAKAANLIGEIASASNQQATAISQINKGIEQVSRVIQTNSATAEQSAAASEELSSQADLLKNMVSKFKLKDVSSSKSQKILLSIDDYGRY